MTPRDRQRIQALATRLAQCLRVLREPRRPAPGPSGDRIDAAFEVIQDYELLSRDLYRLRAARGTSFGPADPLIARTEEFMASLSTDLVHLARPGDARSAYAIFIERYRRIWRENFPLFIFTASTFAGALFVGWNIGRFQENYAPLIVGQRMMEQIIDNRPWFERLAADPLGGAFGIAKNNIEICLSMFALGSIGGLGGLALLLYNGVVIGALMGYCAAHGFDGRLGEFVLSHGFLELTLIAASAFASFLIGRAFYMRPFGDFLEHVSLGAKDGFTVAVGVAPWLALAALFEGFVSPTPLFPIEAKLAAGLAVAALFWLWTLNPFAGTRDGESGQARVERRSRR